MRSFNLIKTAAKKKDDRLNTAEKAAIAAGGVGAVAMSPYAARGVMRMLAERSGNKADKLLEKADTYKNANKTGVLGNLAEGHKKQHGKLMEAYRKQVEAAGRAQSRANSVADFTSKHGKKLKYVAGAGAAGAAGGLAYGQGQRRS